MNARGVGAVALPVVALVAALALDAAGIGRVTPRKLKVAFRADGRAVQVGERWHPLPAIITLREPGRTWLQVVNRDRRGHQLGVLGFEALESTDVQLDACAPTSASGASLVLAR